MKSHVKTNKNLLVSSFSAVVTILIFAQWLTQMVKVV